MRAENLRHAATAVAGARSRRPGLRAPAYRPPRTCIRGRRDFAAGGVVDAGEDPHDAALRELAEELAGHRRATGRRWASGDYADERTRFRGFCCHRDLRPASIRWQPEEVVGRASR